MIDGRDELAILQEDVRRLAGKPGTRWAMMIDLRKCTSCKACTAGCVAEQKSPPGILYRPVYEEEAGKFPRVRRRFTPRLCNQCDNPPCVAACPNAGEGKATWKGGDAEGGVVMINYDQCIGCGRCVPGCPYKARALDAGAFHTEGTPALMAYEREPAWEYGKKWPREKGHVPVGVARKCHFCLHRLRKGMLPACVSTCPCRANFFGDPNDAQGLLSRLLRENKAQVLQAVRGKGEKKLSFAALEGMPPQEIARKVGYPGAVPVFADKAPAGPRVFYILPA